jgi:CBS domain-containing protein
LSGSTWEATMSVLEMCDPEAAAVSVEASVADAVRLMLDRHVGGVAIIDSQNRVAGIFTERDVLRKMALSGDDPAKKPVRDVMTTPVELATLATGPGEALAIMLERHFRHLPVVDHDGKLLGMLSIRNVLQWRVDDLTQELDSLEQYVANDGPGGD